VATYPVKFEDDDKWAIYQSTSESMFSPCFYEELTAHIFAAYYWLRLANRTTDYSDSFQTNFASDITVWLDEIAPKGGKWMWRSFPLAWVKEYDPEPADWDSITDGAYEHMTLDADDLVAAFKSGKGSIVTTILAEFLAWRRKSNPMYELCADCNHKHGHHAATTNGARTCYQNCTCDAFVGSGNFWTPAVTL
jgi:hypothetical protein